jgi:AcrR family transcriptional regulator
MAGSGATVRLPWHFVNTTSIFFYETSNNAHGDLKPGYAGPMATGRARTKQRRREAPTKGDRREQAILDTAETVLEQVGFEEMTVEAIAGGAGISRASLYFYFGSKQEVLAALVARTMLVLDEDARTASEDVASDPRETTRDAVLRTEKHWLEHGRVMRAAVELSGVIPEVGDLWARTNALYIDAMTEVLMRAGLPKGAGTTAAPAMARTLCWMTERNFYQASAANFSARRFRGVSDSITSVWWRVIEAS